MELELEALPLAPALLLLHRLGSLPLSNLVLDDELGLYGTADDSRAAGVVARVVVEVCMSRLEMAAAADGGAELNAEGGITLSEGGKVGLSKGFVGSGACAAMGAASLEEAAADSAAAVAAEVSKGMVWSSLRIWLEEDEPRSDFLRMDFLRPEVVEAGPEVGSAVVDFFRGTRSRVSVDEVDELRMPEKIVMGGNCIFRPRLGAYRDKSVMKNVGSPT